MSTAHYWPELGEPKPIADGEASTAHGYAGHTRIVTPLELAGRGIRRTETLTADSLTERGQCKVGWHVYYVTAAAYAKLCTRYTFARAVLLD